MATTWEEAVAGGSNLLDAADQILRNSWIIDLPIHPTIDVEEETVESGFAECKVLGLHWSGGPTASADHFVVELPSGAGADTDGIEVEAALYQVGAEEASEVGSARLMLLPASFLPRRLVESAPREASALCFSAHGSGAWPASSELFVLYEPPAPIQGGVWVYLGIIEDVSGDPDPTSVLKVALRSSTGEEVEEVYASASEGGGVGSVDPREIVVRV
eukprot:595028-Amphidinium_carterae.2